MGQAPWPARSLTDRQHSGHIISTALLTMSNITFPFRRYSYLEIARDFDLWQEYVDTNAVMTEVDFNALSDEEKIDILTEFFGPEQEMADS